MGFFSGAKRAINHVTGVIKNPGAAIKDPKSTLRDFGQAQSGWTGDTFGIGRNMAGLLDNKPKAPSAGEDPNVTALRNRLYGEAGDFEQNLGNYQKEASDQIEREGSMAMESGIKGTRQDFNRRGLLYSGLREAGEQGVRGRVASTMASQKAQSNQDLNKMATAKATKAAQVGLQGYQDAVSREAEIAGINLQNQVARAQMMQQLGQTGGYLAGSYYGNRSSSPTPSQGINSNYTPNFSSEYRDGNLRADSDYYNNQRIPY